MQSLNCSNCKVEFLNVDIKEHYKSEFHRYNIKRQLVDLPPLTQEQFETRQVLLAQQQDVPELDLKCKTCNKTFATKMTSDQHTNSTKHKEKVKQEQYAKKNPSAYDKPAFKAPIPKETTADDQSVCLFCNKKNGDIDGNLSHMSCEHGFFINSVKHVHDLAGLLRYLSRKTHKGCLCLYCDSELQSGEGVQRHMIDKSHCFMQDDNVTEYYKYYNLSSMLNECNSGSGDSYDQAKSNEEDYYEIIIDGNNENSWGDDENGFKEEKSGANVHKIRVKKAVLLPTAEIKLPNGKLLGHRDFKQYYHQKVRPNILNKDSKDLTPEESEELMMINENNKLVLEERRNEIKSREKEDHINQKPLHKEDVDFLKLGLQANKMQTHFKKQILV